MTIQYSIAIDRDHDGILESEIRQQVIELRWRLGLRQAYDSMADFSWARVTVNNDSGAFSPERNPLTCGTRMRIQSLHGGERRSHFTGAVDRVEPQAGAWGEKQAVIHLHDLQVELESSPARLPPQADVTADQVIAALLDQAVMRPAVIAGHCLIDVAGFNAINSVKIFPPLRPPQRLQRGLTRFAHVGDWWRETTSIRAAIAGIVASERGRFFVNRAGQAVFLNRHHTLTHDALTAEFADDISGLSYGYGDQRLNRLTLLMRPRVIGDDNRLLWQLQSALRIEPHSELNVTARLQDERNQPIGLLAVDRLVSRFQLTESGANVITRNVAATIAEAGTSSALLRIRNGRRHPVFLTQLQLYGRPLYRGDPLEIVAADGEGLYRYGIKQLSLDLPALSDLATAQAFAAYEVARRKHPRGVITEMRINAREHPAAALGASLFDRLRISESHTGHISQDYFIIAEEHHISAGGTRHETRWTLEPADSARFLIVNDSRIGDPDKVLAPY